MAVTAVLLVCFAVLEGAHTVRPVAAVSLVDASGLSRPTAGLRHLALEVAGGAEDLRSPRESGTALTGSELVSAPSRAPLREYVFLPLGTFWAGRVLRRIVSAEPDGH